MAEHIQITAAPGRYRTRVGETLIGETDQASYFSVKAALGRWRMWSGAWHLAYYPAVTVERA